MVSRRGSYHWLRRFDSGLRYQLRKVYYGEFIMKTPEAVKERLRKAGVWKDFADYRAELRNENGDSSMVTYRKAMARFDVAPGTVAGGPKAGIGAGSAEPTPKKKASPPAPDCMSDSDDEVFAMEMVDLNERSCGEVEIIRWVAKNIENTLATPVDAPDPAAWGLLRTCQEDASFKVDFWKSMYTKIIPSRAQLEKTIDVNLDGDEALELLGRIAKASAEAKSEIKESE